MSRHEVDTKNPQYQAFVGWDHPLLTFFVQVYDRVKLDDDIAETYDPDNALFFWKGSSLREIYEIEDLERISKPYVKLSPEIKSTLYGDRDEGK